MNQESAPLSQTVSGFRIRVLLRVMLVIGVITTGGVIATHLHLSRIADQALKESIEQQMQVAHVTRSIRQNVLSEICDSLARKSRILAALEDDALDLLYPSAHDELRQLTRSRHLPGSANQPGARLQARFYRFLDAQGNVITPKRRYAASNHGILPPEFESRIALPDAPSFEEIGYFSHAIYGSADAKHEALEVYAVPIISTEFFRPIAALVVGFPLDLEGDPASSNLRMGYWIDHRLHMPGAPSPLADSLAEIVTRRLSDGASTEDMHTVEINGIPYRVTLRPLNPDSNYPVAHELFVASLKNLKDQQSAVRAQIFTVAGALVLIGLFLSDLIAKRLAVPVTALAEASEEEHSQRLRAEIALDETSRELERAARFSADASHQLKTPVTVMRAGLEGLLESEELTEAVRQEIYDLIRQTGRLSSVIEDLLLLSRLDAGHLQIRLSPLNLALMIEELADDLSALPNPYQISLTTDINQSLAVLGDKRYTVLIFQNLLENARKYNRPDGRILVSAKADDGFISCAVGNTGTGISDSAQSHIFDRFHRGASGENVPGYGLGLNLARELAMRHGGELRLLRSDEDWTEFEVTLIRAPLE